jgi:hypothetical protein
MLMPEALSYSPHFLQICFGKGVGLKDSKSCKCRQEVFCSTKGIIEAKQAKSATSAGELTLID